MKNVFLIGFMGSGKSAVGKRLSMMVDMPFYDMDDVIVEQTGMTIPQIFETYGEQWFRHKETDFLKKTPVDYQIIATGGGVPMRQENRELLRQSGLVFFLNAPFRDIWRRIAEDPNRPIVQRSSKKELEALYYKRKPYYLESAHFKVETSNRSLYEIADYIAFQIERLKGSSI